MNEKDFKNAIENNDGHYLINYCHKKLTQEQIFQCEEAIKNNK